MANTKISALTANTNPTGLEELVYAYNNANGKMTLNTMKAFVGGAGVTTLSADANIWELNDGVYETEYDLYYKTGEAVPRGTGSGLEFKQRISVVKCDGGSRGFLIINSRDRTGVNVHGGWAFYGYSVSSSEGACNQLGARDYVFQNASVSTTGQADAIQDGELTQIVSSATGTTTLRISTELPPYVGVTYTILVNSVSGSYTMSLGTGVTNPFGITLPNSSSKKCVIKILTTSETTGIVTGCTIEP